MPITRPTTPMSFTPTTCGHPSFVVACPAGCHVPGYHLHWRCGSGCSDASEGEAAAPTSGAPEAAAPPERPVGPSPAPPVPMPMPVRELRCGPPPAHRFCEPDFCHVAYQEEPLALGRTG